MRCINTTYVKKRNRTGMSYFMPSSKKQRAAIDRSKLVDSKICTGVSNNLASTDDQMLTLGHNTSMNSNTFRISNTLDWNNNRKTKMPSRQEMDYYGIPEMIHEKDRKFCPPLKIFSKSSIEKRLCVRAR
jgi:hypothetical protein